MSAGRLNPGREGVGKLRLIAGTYQLTSLIGRGPTGAVWQAVHTATEELLAVKLVDPEYADDPATVQRFQRERHLLTTYLDPAFVRVREVVADDSDVALVMELVRAGNLRERLDRSGPLPADEAAQVALVVAEALAAAHAIGVVHSELKPTNLLLTGPAAGVVRLTDARVARLTRGYREGEARFADPRYAAPEVIMGGPPVAATDVYALGLILYEMLTGRPLSPGGLADQLRTRPIVPAGVPGSLRDLIEACVRFDPVTRPGAEEVAEELRRLLPRLELGDRSAPATDPQGAPPVPATSPGPTMRRYRGRPARRPVNRSRIVLFVLLITIVATLTGVILRSLPSAHSDGTAGPTGDTPSPLPASRVATSTSGPPSVPADAKDASAAGATSFVKYWFSALTYASTTGNTAPFQAASAPDCQACTAALQTIRTAWQNGGRLRGGEFTVRSASTDGFFTVDHPLVGVVFDRSPRSTLDSTGTERNSLAGATFASCRLVLVRTTNGWLIRAVQSDQPIF